MSKVSEFLVFVYGTLRQGCSNHFFLEGKSGVKFLGEAVLEGYEMYQIGSYPGIIPSRSGKISGEVYAVDSLTLKELDDLEDEGVEYKREMVKVRMREGSEMRAYVYIWQLGVQGKKKISKWPPEERQGTVRK